MHFVWELQLQTQYALRSNCNKDAYMHEQTTKGFSKMNTCISRFGIHIGSRKYLNEYTPFASVSLCITRPQNATIMPFDINMQIENLISANVI